MSFCVDSHKLKQLFISWKTTEMYLFPEKLEELQIAWIYSSYGHHWSQPAKWFSCLFDSMPRYEKTFSAQTLFCKTKPRDKWFLGAKSSQEQHWHLKLCSQLPWCQQSGISPQRRAQQHAADQSWRWDPESRAARWGSSCRRSRSWNLEETGLETVSSGRSLEEKKSRRLFDKKLMLFCYV